MNELIAEARKHLAALTPGDWTVDECGSEDCWCRCIGSTHPEHAERGVVPSGCMDKHDAEAIVWIRNNLGRILDALEDA